MSGDGEVMSQEEECQVGDRVVYLGFDTPTLGTVFRVNIEIPKESPHAIETRSYDIQLDAGGTFIGMHYDLKRVPSDT
jgi:hypothetical protein